MSIVIGQGRVAARSYEDRLAKSTSEAGLMRERLELLGDESSSLLRRVRSNR
jgi:hypothetical protein